MERKEGEQVGKERKSRRGGKHIHAEKRKREYSDGRRHSLMNQNLIATDTEREGGGAERKIETGIGKEGEHGERIRAWMERKEGGQVGKERKSRRGGKHIHAKKR